MPITKNQAAGITSRQQALESAQAELNTYCSAIVAGHGYDVTQVIGYDEAGCTLTVVPLIKAPQPSVENAKRP